MLMLVGFAVGTRRSRIGLLLFGIGGLALIVPPALTANYVGRYMVPMAGPMMSRSSDRYRRALALRSVRPGSSGRSREIPDRSIQLLNDANSPQTATEQLKPGLDGTRSRQPPLPGGMPGETHASQPPTAASARSSALGSTGWCRHCG